jgi:hypothetical protein
MVQSFATLFPAARHFAYGCMSGRPLATLRENRARRWCVFTSAGDHNNVLSWLAGLDGREWDLVVAFYGDDDAAFERLRPACRAAFRSKGSKFQNLKKLFSSEPQLFEQYDFIWVADDDLTIRPEDVAQLFRYAAEYGFWISQPAFSSEGQISHKITERVGPDSFIRIVNFVELTCPLFRTDKLKEFLSIYDGELVGWGIDWWYCHLFQADHTMKLAIVDDIVALNPRAHQRDGGNREITKLQPNELREAHWQEISRKLDLPEYDMRTLAEIKRPRPADASKWRKLRTAFSASLPRRN